MPAFFEKDLVHFKQIVSPGTIVYVMDHLLYIHQLFKSDWGWGTSRPGPGDTMSFQLGRATLAGIALGLAGLLALRRRKMRNAECGMRNEENQNGECIREIRVEFTLAFLGCATLYFTLQQSGFYWSIIPLAQFVQFPWRLLGLASLTLPALGGPAAELFAGGRGQGAEDRGQESILIMTLLALAGVVVWMVFPYLHSIRDLPITDAELERTIKTEYVNTGLNDYLPRFVPYFDLYNKYWEMNRPFDAWPKAGTLAVTTGTASVAAMDPPIHNVTRGFTVGAQTSATVEWRHFFFPGWHAIVDGKTAAVRHSADGRILLDLAPGDHRIEFKFGNTPLRLAAKFISVLSLLFFAGLLFWRGRSTLK